MRYIKKTIKITTVTAAKLDMDTLTAAIVGSFEVVGGLGERLAVSRARKEFGKDVTVKVENSDRVYRMPLDTFIVNAEVVTDEDENEVEDE